MASSSSSSSSLLSHLSFLSWLLLLLPHSSLSQPFHTITPGTSLSTLHENSSCLSPSDEFAFGLYGLPNKNLFLLAIWFNKIPERTVVWSANGGNPVERGSKLELTTDGQLVLYDNQGKQSWKPEINGSAVTAAMLDTGEFVLQDLNSSRIWGTFDQPTDTILPTQKLHRNSILSSRRTKDDYSNGKLQLHLREDGNLVLYTANVLTRSTYDSPSQSLGNGSELAFDEKGNIGLLQMNGTISNLTQGDSFPTREFYHRATIDVDGVFRQYYYRKAGQSTWSITGAVPSDICMAIISYPGSGVCGFNSYCKLDEKQSPICECPTGFSYLNPNNTLEGCKPNFTAQSCGSNEFRNEKELFKMAPIPNTTWVVSDFEQYGPVDEAFCENSCLDDCLCAVAIFDNGTCLKKRLPLSNGRAGPSINAKTLVKVRKSNSTLSPPDLCKGKKGQATLVLVGSILLGGSGFLNILLVAAISLAFYYYYHKMLLNVAQLMELP
ncbi:hypothetical protein MRB53_005338 [Persea americana]|uniref:Uncharacterized protein n=1 Tax=Persea americana TaxID=3435 RepID=A0ACC2MD97_PERAE|nr:hypothetical protein MRB53_005338 [Persea americana]